jgi:hypothetical protein
MKGLQTIGLNRFDVDFGSASLELVHVALVTFVGF